MKFFLDENISPKIAAGLKGFGEPVVYIEDRFQKGTEDKVLLEFVGKHDMVLITRDNRVRFNPLELAMIKEYGVGAFILRGKEMNRWNQIRQIIKAWPDMINKAKNTEKPFAYLVSFHGRAKELLVLP